MPTLVLIIAATLGSGPDWSGPDVAPLAFPAPTPAPSTQADPVDEEWFRDLLRTAVPSKSPATPRPAVAKVRAPVARAAAHVPSPAWHAVANPPGYLLWGTRDASGWITPVGGPFYRPIAPVASAPRSATAPPSSSRATGSYSAPAAPSCGSGGCPQAAGRGFRLFRGR